MTEGDVAAMNPTRLCVLQVPAPLFCRKPGSGSSTAPCVGLCCETRSATGCCAPGSWAEAWTPVRWGRVPGAQPGQNRQGGRACWQEEGKHVMVSIEYGSGLIRTRVMVSSVAPCRATRAGRWPSLTPVGGSSWRAWSAGAKAAASGTNPASTLRSPGSGAGSRTRWESEQNPSVVGMVTDQLLHEPNCKTPRCCSLTRQNKITLLFPKLSS